MAKQKKKRNKRYTGSEAKMSAPQVVRVAAVKRSKLGQWWFDRKRVVKPLGIAAAVIIVLIWLIFELFRAIL